MAQDRAGRPLPAAVQRAQIGQRQASPQPARRWPGSPCGTTRVHQHEERLAFGEAWQDQGLVFTSTLGTPLDASRLRQRSFHPLLDQAGLPRTRFHDLRHTCATLLLAQGVHPKLVQEQLGHSQISVTPDTYSHVTAPMMKEAAQKMDAILAPNR